MNAADLYLLGVWQNETGYNVAAAYAFHERVEDSWWDFLRLEAAAFESLASPPVDWAESRARGSGELPLPGDPPVR